MNINMISVKQLRENFDMVKSGIAEGKSYILLYRSQPLAEIIPYQTAAQKHLSIEDKLRLVKKLSGGLKLGRNVTPKKLNKIFDTSYDNLLY